MFEKWEIDHWVDDRALKPIKAFHPTAIQKDLDVDLNTIFIRLLELVQDGKLEIMWRVVCPNCFRQLGIYKGHESIPCFSECPECGEQEVTKDIIFPLFSVTEEYRNAVKKNKNYQKPIH